MTKWNKLAVYASVLMITTITFFVVISPRASAGTPVSGYIDSDTFWTLLGSPYWVEGDVIVRNGANLTIEVGVDVLFNGYYSIYIEEGAVLWIDAFINPPYALFSSNSSTKYVGAWRGIQFNESDYDYLSITDSVIEYATYGVRLERASLTIRNSTIRNCIYGIHSNYGFPTIENNTIENCTVDGIYVVDEQPSSLSVNIKNNKIRNNTQHGIILNYVTYARIRNNTIENCTYGIYGSYSSSCIENNIVKNCTGDGIYVLDDETSLTSTDINNNNVSNNGNGINLYLSINNYITTNKISNNNKGIYLLYSSGNVITSNNISNNGYGIYSDHSAPQIGNNTIAYNTEDGAHITGNCPSGGYPNLENNTVYSNIKCGIVLYDVQNTRLRNNNISNNNYNFGVWADTLSEFNHDIDTTNTVNQKPIYYWRNHEHDDESVPSNAGYVGIVNSTNITAENLILTHNGQGILVGYSNYTKINNVTASDNELGILLYSSPSNIVQNSNISNNDYNGYYPLGHGASGIYLQSSFYNNITGNNVSSNIRTGIYTAQSSYNDITSNNALSNNWCGIDIFASSNNNSITGNNASFNIYNGIHLHNSSDNNVISNIANSNNDCGIPIEYSSYRNNITGNTVSSNEIGIYLSSSDDSNITGNAVLNNIYGINLVISSGNNVKSNNISNNELGIYTFLSSNNNITNNSVLNNEYGIYLNYSWNNNISYCNISSNDYDGIYLIFSSLNEIYENIITWNNLSGIYCTSSSDPTIKSNDIENNTWYGVWSGGGSDPVINYNNICNNGGGAEGEGYGVINTYLLITIDAQNNWWNDPDGPGGVGPGNGDQVSSGVDYDPWSGTRF